jgi:hypothetical protein
MINHSTRWSDNLSEDIKNAVTFDISLPINSIEIGCFEGIGTQKIVDTLCHHPESRVTCIDPFDDVYIKGYDLYNKSRPHFNKQYDRFIHNTQSISHKIILKRGYSNDILKQLNGTYDFIYIDGDHRADVVYIDAVLSFQLLRVNGVILFDDYFWVEEDGDGPKLGIDRFVEENRESIEIISDGTISRYCIRRVK